jgi:hypothetical protein
MNKLQKDVKQTTLAGMTERKSLINEAVHRKFNQDGRRLRKRRLMRKEYKAILRL